MPTVPNYLVQVASLKTWVNATGADEDELITDICKGITAQIGNHCARDFFSASFTAVADGAGTARITLRHSPVSAVSSVKVNGVIIPLSTAYGIPGYVIDEEGISIRGGKMFERGVKNVEISYTAGYSTVPDDVMIAAKIQGGIEYKSRTRIGEISKQIQQTTITFSHEELSPEVVAKLAPYVRLSQVFAI